MNITSSQQDRFTRVFGQFSAQVIWPEKESDAPSQLQLLDVQPILLNTPSSTGAEDEGKTTNKWSIALATKLNGKTITVEDT